MSKVVAVDVEAILRDRIARRLIPPGAKLRELPLTRELGVSRARVREAFVSLEQRGLVKRVPNQGVTVISLTANELFTIYDVFEILEGLCVRLAVQNTDPTQWQGLVEIFDEDLRKAIEQGDFLRLFDAVMKYRAQTAQAANNPTLSGFLSSIYDKTQIIIQRTLVLPGRAEQSFREHCAIVAAMRSGNAMLAEELKRANMRTAREFLIRYIDFVL